MLRSLFGRYVCVFALSAQAARNHHCKHGLEGQRQGGSRQRLDEIVRHVPVRCFRELRCLMLLCSLACCVLQTSLPGEEICPARPAEPPRSGSTSSCDRFVVFFLPPFVFCPVICSRRKHLGDVQLCAVERALDAFATADARVADVHADLAALRVTQHPDFLLQQSCSFVPCYCLRAQSCVVCCCGVHSP